MSAGQKAKGLALNHSGNIGEAKRISDLTVDTGRQGLQVGAGVGSVIARSDDGRHSLGAGAYSNNVIGGGKMNSDPNVGAAVGYRFSGDSTSVAAAVHKQTFGKKGAEHGGSLGVEHRLNNHHSVSAGISQSKFDSLGDQFRKDTSLSAGYRFDINDRSSVSAAGHRTTYDFGVTELGRTLGASHRFDDQHSLFGGLSQSRFEFPGGQSRTDNSSFMGYRFSINDTAALSATGHRTTSDFGGNMGRETSHGISLGFHKSF